MFRQAGPNGLIRAAWFLNFRKIVRDMIALRNVAGMRSSQVSPIQPDHGRHAYSAGSGADHSALLVLSQKFCVLKFDFEISNSAASRFRAS